MIKLFDKIKIVYHNIFALLIIFLFMTATEKNLSKQAEYVVNYTKQDVKILLDVMTEQEKLVFLGIMFSEAQSDEEGVTYSQMYGYVKSIIEFSCNLVRTSRRGVLSFK